MSRRRAWVPIAALAVALLLAAALLPVELAVEGVARSLAVWVALL